MFGLNNLSTNSILPNRVLATGDPIQKAGGITIDWSTVAATGSLTTTADGSTIQSGLKFLRYGQIMCKISGGTNTLNTSGTPTGGTFTITVETQSPTADSAPQTTAAIAYNASAATVAAAIGALTNVGAANVSATGGALTSAAVTLVFAPILGTVIITAGNNSLTGGTAPAIALGASITTGSTDGWFGPYDPTASDGRQTLARGDCVIMDETLLQYGTAGSLVQGENTHTGALEGGGIWIDRVLQSGTAAHSLAAGPTLTEFLAAFPLIRAVRN